MYESSTQAHTSLRETCWDTLGPVGTQRDPLGSVGTRWDPLVTLGPHYVCFVDWPSSRVDYTERRKTKRKQRKNSQIKIHEDLHQGELPQREESLRKTFIVFMLNDLPVGVDNTKRRKTWRKKGKCPKSRFIKIWLQGVLPQRVKRLRKTFIVFYGEWPSSMDR
jgi:hypothetical protein